MLSLSNIKKSKGASQKKKIVGRGNSSGMGTTATRGTKGQKARSGVSGLKRLGMRQQLLQIPKLRGFRSLKKKNQVVSVEAINKNFKDGDKITAQSLFEKDLIRDASNPVKILGKQKLTVKVDLSGVNKSGSVKAQI
ncbi:MAG: 50S ribosomal protein L15 [Planctomycetes bacterium]|jgi:large subunit ribosomal protein L15|nr:50S ribosomal protein L15 [Planctomycetota bacterium]